MFCQACGAQNSEGARFCNMCGSQIAPPGSPGGMVADGTVKAPGGQPAPGVPSTREAAALAGTEPAQPAVPGAPSGAPSPAAPAPAPEQNVWDQAGASAQPRAHAGGGLSQIGHSTLAGVGVQSSKRAWAIVIGIAIVLVGLGAAAGFAMGGEEAPEPEDYDPDVEVAEIGMPMPEGMDLPEADIFDDPHGIPVSTGTGGGGSSSMGAGSGGSGSAPTTTVGGSGTMATAMTGSGTGSSTSMTSTSTGSGSSTSMTGSSTGSGSSTSMAGSSTGSGSSTSMTGTSTGTGSSTSMTGTSTGSGSNTIPADVPEERDIAMSMYSQRVRYVISRYYASRAQSCFDHASRNSPSVSGQVRVSVTIAADGTVSRSTIAQNTTGNEQLGQCLVSNTRQWRLPPPPGGELTMVLPFRN